MFVRRRLALSALAATALSALAAPASAQQIDRIVAFGDSYADTGNAVAILLANPATPAGTKTLLQTLYPQGRFSGGGTNYIDTLSDILNVPAVSYAVGGATTGAVNNAFPGLPSLSQEVAIFLANTTPPGTIFPVADGFQEGDLLALSIGGNDARAFYTANPLATTTQASAAAAVSVAQATANVDVLVGAGAETISFLALDASGAPDLLGSPTNQALAAAFSNSFNTGFQTTLAGYAADGVIVHYLDGATLLDNVLANPAAYGISNIYCPAAPAPTCIISSAGYLFYADGVHLTPDGFKIVAQYVATQLAAPLTLQGASDLGMDSARRFARGLSARMDLGAPRDGGLPEGLKFFIAGDSFSRSVNESEGNAPFDVNSIGANAGVEYGFGSGVVGAAVSISRPELDFGGDISEVDGRSVEVGAYAAMGLAGAFLQGYLGFGWDDYEITRSGVVENMDVDTDGDHFLAGAKAGYLMPLWSFRVGPVAALDYAKVNVEGYTEDGDPALTLNVSDTDFSSLRGSIGIEGRGDFSGDGVQFRPFTSVMLEKELGDGDRSISFAQTSAPGIVNTFDFENVSKKAYLRTTGGLNAQIFDNIQLSAAISRTMGKKQGNETSGHVGLKVGF